MPITDPVQAKVMQIMPIVFTILFFFFPSGLVLYWLVNNTLPIAQQWQVKRLLEKSRSLRPSAADRDAGRKVGSDSTFQVLGLRSVTQDGEESRV